jgi:hypothetical protein
LEGFSTHRIFFGFLSSLILKEPNYKIAKQNIASLSA